MIHLIGLVLPNNSSVFNQALGLAFYQTPIERFSLTRLLLGHSPFGISSCLQRGSTDEFFKGSGVFIKAKKFHSELNRRANDIQKLVDRFFVSHYKSTRSK